MMTAHRPRNAGATGALACCASAPIVSLWKALEARPALLPARCLPFCRLPACLASLCAVLHVPVQTSARPCGMHSTHTFTVTVDITGMTHWHWQLTWQPLRIKPPGHHNACKSFVFHASMSACTGMCRLHISTGITTPYLHHDSIDAYYRLTQRHYAHHIPTYLCVSRSSA